MRSPLSSAKKQSIFLYLCVIFFPRWEDGKKPAAEIKKEATEEKKPEEEKKPVEEEEDDESEPDPNDMSIPVGAKKLMRRCFNPVTGSLALPGLKGTVAPV